MTQQTNKGMQEIAKALSTASIKIAMLDDLCDKVADYFTEAQQDSPQAAVYGELFNYIWGELQEINSTLKRIK